MGGNDKQAPKLRAAGRSTHDRCPRPLPAKRAGVSPGRVSGALGIRGQPCIKSLVGIGPDGPRFSPEGRHLPCSLAGERPSARAVGRLRVAAFFPQGGWLRRPPPRRGACTRIGERCICLHPISSTSLIRSSRNREIEDGSKKDQFSQSEAAGHRLIFDDYHFSGRNHRIDSSP
jgi:hypothetical protein